VEITMENQQQQPTQAQPDSSVVGTTGVGSRKRVTIVRMRKAQPDSSVVGTTGVGLRKKVTIVRMRKAQPDSSVVGTTDVGSRACSAITTATAVCFLQCFSWNADD
jgi:hydrogenase maturation factor